MGLRLCTCTSCIGLLGGALRLQVGLKAYLLWESNGRQDGADFSGQARQELEAELRAGSTVEEIERRLKAVRSPLPHRFATQAPPLTACLLS